MSGIARCPATKIHLIRDVGNLWAEFAALVPAAHSFEDVCHPRYFGARRTHKPKSARSEDDGLRIQDTIYVRSEDRSYIAELMVTAIPDGLDEVHTRVIRHIEFKADDVPDGYVLKYMGMQNGWAITINDTIIEKGFMTEEAANLRLIALLSQQSIMNAQKPATRRSKAKADA